MFNKNKNDQGKPKEFTVSDYDISELTFLAMQRRAKEEEYTYYSQRAQMLQDEISKRLGLDESYDVDFSKLFATGKIFAIKKPVQPQAEVQVHEQDAEPQLPEEQSQRMAHTEEAQ